MVVVGALAAALAAPVATADNGTSTKGYGGQAQVQDEISKAGSNGSGSLPLTGTDLGLLVLGGGLFAGVGFAVRRASRRHE